VEVLVVDNYDSFTYNLVQSLRKLGARVVVRRNDEASLATLRERRPAGLLVSPGPGAPDGAGVSVAAVRRFGRAGVPVFGVCLGHQAIGAAFGGRVVRARSPMHGKTTPILHAGAGVFRDLPTPFDATRYPSLVIERSSCPAVLEVTARTPDGEIMGVRHRNLPVEGVQFHPESILTVLGEHLLRNFLDDCRRKLDA
jgi:anthranilate synthase/aminodeoxychorismate synthase-like glutamine amidotransferase